MHFDSNTSSFVQTSYRHRYVTVGPGVAPGLPFPARGLYRRSGFAPCPEDILIQLFLLQYSMAGRKCKTLLENNCGRQRGEQTENIGQLGKKASQSSRLRAADCSLLEKVARHFFDSLIGTYVLRGR